MTSYELEAFSHRERIGKMLNQMFENPRITHASVAALAIGAQVSEGAAYQYIRDRNCSPVYGIFQLSRPKRSDDLFY